MISSIRIPGLYGRALDLPGIRTESLRLAAVTRLTPETIRERLRVLPDDVHLLEHLATLAPTGRASLPSPTDAPALLERLAVAPEDAAEILAHWPSEAWPAELLWLLERVPTFLAEHMGSAEWLAPGPELDPSLGPEARLLSVYTYLARVEAVRAWNAERGIPDDVTWATLADLGRNLAIDRRMKGAGWPIMAQWLTLHVRGGIYELGRLQYQRGQIGEWWRDTGLEVGTWALSLHIQEAGPLTPEACDESLALAREFFPRHFPEEPYSVVTCGSWLLDPQLAEYLPEDSNMVRFQRRFTLTPDVRDAGIEIFRFVFRRIDAPLDELPQDTTLQRAVVAHVRAGRQWHDRSGWFDL
jgi:hypothetical protein